MKNITKLSGIIALMAVIGFSMAACPTEGEGNGEGEGNAVLGEKLELSGQVYTMEWPEHPTSTITYPAYKGNLTLNDNNGGTVTITDGKFGYTLETPTNFQSWDDIQNELLIARYYDDITVSDTNAKVFMLNFYTGDPKYYEYSLRIINYSINGSIYTYTIDSEAVDYVHVDKDVTISGKGKTTYTENHDDVGYTVKTNDFSLALKTGWNVVYRKFVHSVSSNTDTVTMSLRNPSSLKWVLFESVSSGGGPATEGTTYIKVLEGWT
jgi:hypothetical protein